MALKPDLHYFKHSINNPEVLELRYMFLEWDKDINKYVETTKKLNKLVSQQIDIINALKKNETSFWFNTAGFKEFVKDFSLSLHINPSSKGNPPNL